MSLYSIKKYIFNNAQYSKIVNWYDKQYNKTSGMLWAEFLKETKCYSENINFEIKEHLYKNRKILDVINSIFDKSRLLISKYPKQVDRWKSKLKISSGLQYFQLKSLVDSENLIMMYHRYDTLATECKRGLDAFLNKNKSCDINSDEGLEFILKNTHEIKLWDTDIASMNKLKKDYSLGFNSFVNDNTFVNLSCYEGVHFVVENSNDIKTRQKNIKAFDLLSKAKKKGLKLYLQENKDINTKSYDGIRFVLENETTISDYESKTAALNELEKSNPEGFLSFRKDNAIPSRYSLKDLITILSNIDEIISRQKTISTYTKYSTQYTEGLNLFLKENPQLNVDSYEDLVAITKNNRKIKYIDGLISCNNNLKTTDRIGYKSFLSENSKIDTNQISGLKFIVEHDTEIKKREKDYKAYKSLQKKYPLGLKHYISLSNIDTECYSGVVSILESRKIISEYNSKLSFISNLVDKFNESSIPNSLNLTCDYSDKNAKVRCILNSFEYGNSVTFTDSYTIANFYKLEELLLRNDTSFDVIADFRKANAHAIKSYNQNDCGKYCFYTNDFEQIAIKNPKLMDWIKEEQIRQLEIQELSSQASKLKAKYPYGYVMGLKDLGLNSTSKEKSELLRILASESLFHDKEVIHTAMDLQYKYPDAVYSLYNINSSLAIKYDLAMRMISNVGNIQNKQNQIILLRKEEEERQNRLARAKNIYNSYPDGVLSVCNIRSPQSITDSNAISIINSEYEIRCKQNELNTYKSLQAHVSGWYTHTWNGIVKHKWQCDYYSYGAHKDYATSSMWDTWKYVWHFKNDPTKSVTSSEYKEALDRAVNWVESELRSTFGSDVQKLTLVCLSASTRNKNDRRFKPFAERVCSDLNMYNAYNYVRIITDGEAKHEGGTVAVGKSYDSNWFKGKYIVLFDDVRTSGRGIERERQTLQSFGAYVICAITLAQTTN